MNAILPEDTSEFLRSFEFCDSQIKSITLDYANGSHPSIAVVIAARDTSRSGNEEWVQVKLTVGEVDSFCFRQLPRTTSVVISDGIQILHEGGLLGFGLNTFVDADPFDFSELRTSGFVSPAAHCLGSWWNEKAIFSTGLAIASWTAASHAALGIVGGRREHTTVVSHSPAASFDPTVQGSEISEV